MTRSDKRFLAKLTKAYLKRKRGIEVGYVDIYPFIEDSVSRDEIDLIQFADYCEEMLFRKAT